MKSYFPIFLTLIFSSLLFLSSCKDKKAANEKIDEPVEIQKKAPKIVEPEPVKEATTAPPTKSKIKKIVVKEGEWLYNISRREYGNSQGWEKIYNANKDLIVNPDLIYPNQELVIPD